MLHIHRWAVILAGLLILYVASTGVWMQSMDIYAQVTHQPVTHPTLQEFHQHLNGTDAYAVISDPDYPAQSLPQKLDVDGALARVEAAARAAAPDAPMKLIELRMTGDRLTGHVRMGKAHMLFDAATGDRLPDALLPPANPNAIKQSLRSDIKSWHKFAFNKFLLQKASIFDLLAAIGVAVLFYTGAAHYFRLLKARRKIGKPQLFWSAGGTWRKLHRWTATVLGVVIVYLAVTGTLMAISDIGAAYAEYKSPRDKRPVNPDTGDFSSPLQDKEISPMAHATLAAFGAGHPGVGLKVLRLRYFVGYPQGAVVTGEDPPLQHVYDTRNGREMSETEPGYPISNFPFGWQWHQTVKKFHRGDIFGLKGNILEWIGGIGLIYFAVSGFVMYFQMWRRRARAGRRQLTWK